MAVSASNKTSEKAKSRKKESTNSPFIHIPANSQTLPAFLEEMRSLITDKKTVAYLDTSFLMWMTKIGPTSRLQLIHWLDSSFLGRVFVPIWSAHEYLKHHVSDTLQDELTATLNRFDKVAANGYAEMRPFLDTILDDQSQTAEDTQADLRRVLNELSFIAKRAAKWAKRYPAHASDVLSLINRLSPPNSPVFEVLKGIRNSATDRFDGRVPPGFNDWYKDKKKQFKEAQNEEIPSGGNAWGDLVFWKEVLQLATAERAGNILILTNDEKNDWQLGGRDNPNDLDLLKLLPKPKPFPVVHPMLALEARLTSKVARVGLLDSVYLGVLLLFEDETKNKELIDVAIVPEARQETVKQQRKKAAHAAMKENAVQSTEKDGDFEDSPTLVDSISGLRLALLKSKNGVARSAELAAFLMSVGEALSSAQSIATVFTPAILRPLNAVDLVSFARDLSDEVLNGGQGSTEALVDLCGLLENRDLPALTLSCIYLGFLASMYLDRDTNERRPRPQSVITKEIFSFQSKSWAARSLEALNSHFKRRDRPIYLPDIPSPQIRMEIDHEPETDQKVFLNRVILQGIDVFESIQAIEIFQIPAAKTQEVAVSLRSILDFACEIYGIPFAALDGHGIDVDRIYFISQGAGLRLPDDVYEPYAPSETDHTEK